MTTDAKPIDEVIDVEPQPTSPPYGPKFVPGDYIVIKLVDWPPNSGNTIRTTGLYDQMGFPMFPLYAEREAPRRRDFKAVDALLNQNLAGTVRTGDRCLVIAVAQHADGKWYYLVNNGKPKGFGWTRCGFRMEKA
jgi:hypothetical protein